MKIITLKPPSFVAEHPVLLIGSKLGKAEVENAQLREKRRLDLSEIPGHQQKCTPKEGGSPDQVLAGDVLAVPKSALNVNL